MAQTSFPWTDATGDGGPYAAETWDNIYEHLFQTDQAASEGVLEGDGGELVCEGVATPITVGTGAAVVKGKIYINTAVEEVSIPLPTAATRVDRIVLRADFSAQEVRIARLAGVEGGGAPNLTQVDGTTWEISLAQASVTTGGEITITDERAFCHFGTRVSNAMLDADCVDGTKIADDSVDSEHYAHGSIDTIHIADEQVTAAKIANRTRIFAANILPRPNAPSQSHYGCELSPGYEEATDYHFIIPNDYVSDLKVRAIVIHFQNGTFDIRYLVSAYCGVMGSANYSEHIQDESTLSMAKDTRHPTPWIPVSGAYVAAGNIVFGSFVRFGQRAADTLEAVLYLQAIEVSYTADS